jgi:hypothetical protein
MDASSLAAATRSTSPIKGMNSLQGLNLLLEIHFLGPTCKAETLLRDVWPNPHLVA